MFILPFLNYYLCEMGLFLVSWFDVHITIAQNIIQSVRSADPSFLNFLNLTTDGIAIFMHFYQTAFTARFVLAWFPNINPFIQPYYIVRVVTEPFIEWVRFNILFEKTIFGFDFSFLICSYILAYGAKYLTLYKFTPLP